MRRWPRSATGPTTRAPRATRRPPSGNRIAEAVLAYGATDGAHEEERYKDASYKPVNEPLEVAKPGTVMDDPNRWQPLALAQQISQNGLPIPGQVQSFIGPYWGHVTSFALPASDAGHTDRSGPATDAGHGHR